MRKLTQEQVLESFRKVHGDRYDYSKFVYNGTHTKSIFICKIHGEFETTPKTHLKTNCAKCSNNFPKTTEIFVEEAKAKWGDKYDYSKVNYTNNINKVEVICRDHGIFEIAPVEHLAGSTCRTCYNDRMRKGIDKFIEESNKTHNNKYDYSKFEYIDWQTKSIIICPKHGEFAQTPNSHMYAGCRACGYDDMRVSLGEFKEKCYKMHDNFYNYDNVKYDTLLDKVNINCPKHGSFLLRASKHINDGIGCTKCAIEARTKSQEDFIKEVLIIHNSKYDYSEVIYTGCKELIIIKCPIHGAFKQMAMTHLLGSGCQKCSHRISKPETEWLDYLGIPEENRQTKIRINGRLLKPDGFDPNDKVFFEMNGDFWHGNPQIYDPNDINSATKTTFGELYQKTLAREQFIKDAGYTLVTIWESEWNELKNKI